MVFRNFVGNIFSIKVPLAPGNCDFVFSAQARNFSECQRPEMGQKTSKLLVPAGGGPTEKEVVPKKVAENHPG